MDTPAKSARTNLAIQVFRQNQAGMTVCDACKVVGLARSSFYFIVHNNPEAFIEFQEIIKAEEKREFLMLLVSHRAILDELIQDALSETTSPRDRLAIAKALSDRFDKLANKHLQHSSDDKAAREVLTGPVARTSSVSFQWRAPQPSLSKQPEPGQSWTLKQVILST